MKKDMTKGQKKNTQKNTREEQMEELIQLKEIKKYFSWKKHKYVKAVDSVSLSINKRDIFGLVGESGSGKTTLGR
jgi:ABC-type oligopeptide transport system ATPase subunit